MDYTTTTEPPPPTTTTSSPPTTTTTSDEPTTTTTTTTSYTTTTTYEPPPITTTTRDDPTTTTTRYVTSSTTTRYVPPVVTTTTTTPPPPPPPPPPTTTTTTRRRTRTHTTAYYSTSSSSQTSYVPSSASSLGPGPPPTHTPSGGDSSGMSTGGIVGIAIGAAAALILALGLLLVWVRRHRRRRQGEMSFSPILPGMQERQRPTGTNAVAAAAASTTPGRIGGGANGGSTNGMGRDSFEPLSNGYHQSGISARTDTTHAASSMAPLSALAAGGTAGALMANGCQRGDDEANLRHHRLSGGYYDAGDYHMAMNDPHGGISYQPPTDDTGYAYSQDRYDPNYAARMHQQQQQMYDEANYASHEQPYATDAYYSNMYDEAAAAATAAGGGYGYNQYPADYYGTTQGYSHPDYAQGHSMYYDPTTPSPSVAQSSTPSSSQLLHPTTSAAPGAVPTSAAGGQGYAYPESDARWSKKTVSPSETPLAAGIAAGAAGAAGALASSSSTKDTRPISTASLPPEEIKPSLLQQRRQQAFQGQQQQHQPSLRASPSLTGSPSVGVVNADSAATPPLATTRQSSLSQHSSQNESQMPQGRTSIVSVDSTGTGATRSPQTVDKTGVPVGSPSQSDVEEDLQHLHSLRNSGTSTDWSPRNPQTIIRKDPQMGATGEDYSGPSVIIDDHDASYKVPLPEDHGSGNTK
ncbi:hypothetical protein BGW42_001700 [Actinomortierella wolfii]|nr:hypothetical protein BGW42_001700 [Actinomortierella wolfii]